MSDLLSPFSPRASRSLGLKVVVVVVVFLAVLMLVVRISLALWVL